MLFEINVEFFTLVRNSEGLMIDRFDLMFKRFVMQLILKMKQSYLGYMKLFLFCCPSDVVSGDTAPSRLIGLCR